LLENEAESNLLIGIITADNAVLATDWLMATIVDETGDIALIALCTHPFNLLLHGTGNSMQQDAVELLSFELRRIGVSLPGVMAERELARSFAKAFSPPGSARFHMTSNVMRLDKLAAYIQLTGFRRALEERDLIFTPYWENAFSVECRTHVFSIEENADRIKKRLGKDTHFFWEDGTPVSQAVYGRETPNGAVINFVYTPTQYRGRGYATAVVAELSDSLLKSGKQFCCLFADADNKASCAVYRKLGYYDVCVMEEIRFC